MYRVFLDTGVLITAFRGKPEMRQSALAILSDTDYEFWYSPLLRLELMLQPSRNKRALEIEFLQEYFTHAQCYGDLNKIFEISSPDAMRHGIPVLDALHIGAATAAKFKVLFTTEARTKPLFRTNR